MSRLKLVRCLMRLLILVVVTSAPALAQTIVIGGKDFTEQLLMAEITSQFLKQKGYATRVRTGLSTPGIRTEQEVGLVDVYWEYTGTALLNFHKVSEKLDPNDAYTRVKDLDAEKGLVWLSPSKVNNTYALAMRKSDAIARGIASISDLGVRIRRGERFRIASNTEFFIRPDGLAPLQRAYRFAFGAQDIVRMDPNAIYDALRDGSLVDLGLVFSTDGRVTAFNFLLLEDDQKFFPSYLLTPVIRQRVLDQHPELAGYLNAIAASLDNDTIARLNGSVDLQNREIEEVALSFLNDAGLL
jgi:osmoprotectant transport system substrate-binding protein